jgi:hypothetical protein
MMQCIFCTAEADSPEHGFPRWIGRHLDSVVGHPPNLDTDSWSYEAADDRYGSSFNRKWIASEYASIEERIVCGACNNGWMSDIETAAAPVMKPMIAGTPKVCGPRQVRNLAAWATKTAMTLEMMLPEDSFMRDDVADFSRKEREHLKHSLIPPTSIGVLCAATELTGITHSYRRVLTKSETPFGTLQLAFHTIQINTLVLQVVRRFDVPEGIEFRNDVTQTDLEIPVFPQGSDFAWPPEKVIPSVELLERYARRGLDATELPVLRDR